MTTNQPNSQAFATAAAIADAQRAATEAERARCLRIIRRISERRLGLEGWQICSEIQDQIVTGAK